MARDQWIGWVIVGTCLLTVLAGIARQAVRGYRSGPGAYCGPFIDPTTEEGQAWIRDHEVR